MGRAPDLHTHSSASDGTLSPSEIVRSASGLGVPAVAITDHDTVDGVAEALAEGLRCGVHVIPGVELSAGVGDRGMHILGYHIDHTDPTLLARLAGLREIRMTRAERIVTALQRDGITITPDDVEAAADGGTIGRAHIARLLVENGAASSVADAFERLLGEGRPYYVPKPVSEPADAVGLIVAAGGVPVLAHPQLSRVDDLIPELVSAGIRGLEAYHAQHDPATAARYAQLAESLGLVVTGGSDFHDPDRDGVSLGDGGLPVEAIEALGWAAGRRSHG